MKTCSFFLSQRAVYLIYGIVFFFLGDVDSPVFSYFLLVAIHDRVRWHRNLFLATDKTKKKNEGSDEGSIHLGVFLRLSPLSLFLSSGCRFWFAAYCLFSSIRGANKRDASAISSFG